MLLKCFGDHFYSCNCLCNREQYTHVNCKKNVIISVSWLFIRDCDTLLAKDSLNRVWLPTPVNVYITELLQKHCHSTKNRPKREDRNREKRKLVTRPLNLSSLQISCQIDLKFIRLADGSID